jgi:hypothetical protein
MVPSEGKPEYDHGCVLADADKILLLQSNILVQAEDQEGSYQKCGYCNKLRTHHKLQYKQYVSYVIRTVYLSLKRKLRHSPCHLLCANSD